MRIEDGQAGALSQGEIKVTPEMIEAAQERISLEWPDWPSSYDRVSEFVADIYRVMRRAR